MNYDELQAKLHETPEQTKRRELDRKTRQRERQRDWLIKHYGVKSAEALVTLREKSGD